MRETMRQCGVQCASVLVMIALAGCAPVVQQNALYTPRSSRLDDRTFRHDLIRFDSAGKAMAAEDGSTPAHALNRARAVMLIGLAREAYERNDDGRLTTALVMDAEAAQMRTRRSAEITIPTPGVPRTVRLDYWGVLDSVAASPSAAAKRDQLIALETALLRAQYDVLGAPSCDAWKLEAERIVAQLRITLRPPAAPASEPTPRPAAVPPAPQPAPRAPETLSGVPSRVHFALNRHDLAPRTQQVLDALVKAVAAFPEVTIVLEGNTDQRGSVEYNQALSKRRAESVRSFLLSRGIADARISIRVLGKSNLESADNSVVQLARNRRVMIRYFAPDGREIPAVSQVDDLQLEKTKPE